MSEMTWREALLEVSRCESSKEMRQRADEVVDQIPEKIRRKHLVSKLVDDAAMTLRKRTEAAEREAFTPAPFLTVGQRAYQRQCEAIGTPEHARRCADLGLPSNASVGAVKKAAAAKSRKDLAKRRSELGLSEDVDEFEVINASLLSAIEGFKRAIRVEWTKELLESAFPLRDGTRVTWGNATLEQHQERADLFRERAETNLETVARHSAAIDAIKAANATCLNELQRAA